MASMCAWASSTAENRRLLRPASASFRVMSVRSLMRFPPLSRLGAGAPRLATLPPASGGQSEVFAEKLLPSWNERRCRWTNERQRVRRDGGEKSFHHLRRHEEAAVGLRGVGEHLR